MPSSRAGAAGGPGRWIVGFIFAVIVYAIFALLGGLLGAVLFKKDLPPPPPPGTIDVTRRRPAVALIDRGLTPNVRKRTLRVRPRTIGVDRSPCPYRRASLCPRLLSGDDCADVRSRTRSRRRQSTLCPKSTRSSRKIAVFRPRPSSRGRRTSPTPPSTSARRRPRGLLGGVRARAGVDQAVGQGPRVEVRRTPSGSSAAS